MLHMHAHTHARSPYMHICPMHACMHGMMQMYGACGAHVDACMHADTHAIHICICIHARMYACGHTYACGHACACRHTRTQSIYGYVFMVRCGWMAHHACGHVCTCMCCFDGAGVWFPVSLSRMHAPWDLSAWDSCVALSAPRDLSSWDSCVAVSARHVCRTWIYLPGIPVSGCAARTHVGVGGVPAGVVPHVLRTRAHVRGLPAHVHRREAPAGRVPHGLWIMHACAPHIHTHTRMHTTYTCAWHAHTCTFLLHAHHIHTHIHVYMHICVTHPETTQHVGAACIARLKHNAIPLE